MNYNKNCRCEKPPEEENCRLHVLTTTCPRCGREVSLTMDELIAHIREIGEGTYHCPLCRQMSDAEKDDIAADDRKPEDGNAREFLEGSLVAFITGMMNLMVLGSWIVASEYELPEYLVTEIVTRTVWLLTNRMMEDERNDSDETESDSDEAAAACAGCGGAKPPEGPDPGTAERDGSGISLQADLRVQTDVHLSLQIRDVTP